MDILKAFKLVNKDIEINIKGTIDNPLFQANQIGSILGIKNISDSLSDFLEDEKVIAGGYTRGGMQKIIFLTELGLYKLLGRSKKPIAALFQKWVINTVKEIRINGIYKLNEEKEIDKKLLKHNYDINNHKTYLKAFDKKNVVYICKFKNIEDKLLIKLGSSQDVKQRISHISNAFESIEPIIIDITEIDNHIKFETFLHNNDFIKKFYYPISNKEGKISKETYLVNEEECKEFIKIINNFKNKFINIDKEYELKKQELSLEKIKLSIELENIKLKQKELNQKELENEIELKKLELENKFIIEKDHMVSKEEILSEEESETDIDLTTCNYKIKTRKNGIRVPKVYQYNPDNLYTPIKNFDSPAEVERELNNLDISPSSLRLSAKKNTIYKNYRWLFLNRDENIPEKISDTEINKHKSTSIQLIAMINIKKTKILEVFPSQKDALEARDMKSNSFTRAIQQQSISSGHYWQFFNNCSNEMKEEYLKNNKLPEKFKPKYNKVVQQIDPKTKEVIKVYNSNRDVIKRFQMSSTTLRNISQSGEIHNGYIWKII
jgi:prophage antirepressor-like protein